MLLKESCRAEKCLLSLKSCGCCIQEAHMINLMFRDRIGNVFSSSLNNSKRGVAIIVCKKLNFFYHKKNTMVRLEDR